MSWCSCLLLLPGSREKYTGLLTVWAKDDNFPVIRFFDHVYLQQDGPRWDGSHRPRYLVYLHLRHVQLRDAITIAYRNPLSARVTTQADHEPPKVKGTHEQRIDNVDGEHGVCLPKMKVYFVFSEICEEIVLMTLLGHSDLQLCLWSNLRLIFIYKTYT